MFTTCCISAEKGIFVNFFSQRDLGLSPKGLLYCILWQDSLHSQYLFPPLQYNKWVPANCPEILTKFYGIACDGLALHADGAV